MIQKSQYESFLKSVTDELEGDWVLIGGSLLLLLGASTRATTDIDICPIGEMDNEKRLMLMEIAMKANLPIEAINPSADFFLRKISSWKFSVMPLVSGKKGNVFRPSIQLYFKLKLARGSDSDIEDCKAFLEWHKQNSFEIPKGPLTEIVKSFKDQKFSDLLKSIAES